MLMSQLAIVPAMLSISAVYKASAEIAGAKPMKYRREI
jgi:hypothetical protein